MAHIGVLLLSGGLRFTAHETDMLHLAALVTRMAGGEVPHLDFATPIGDWAIRPMALMMQAGLPLGRAMIWGQVLVAAAVLPAATWVAVTRLDRWPGIVLLVVTLGLTTGLVFGGTAPLISLSMHYNRWAWAMALVVVVAVLLPRRAAGGAVADGLVIGLLMAALAMIKVTYAVSLAPAVIMGLLVRADRAVLAIAVAAALAVLAAVTLAFGPGYWPAYAGDLLAVAGSANRPMPSDPLIALILSPRGTPVTAVALVTVWLLGRAGRRDLAATLLLALAAFTFIAWQNFGNDPVWLAGLAILAWAWGGALPGWQGRGLLACAGVAAVLILPVMANILYSPLRHLTQPAAAFRPLLPGDDSLAMVTARAGGAWAQVAVIDPPGTAAVTFAGRPLPDCKLQSGLVAVIERDLAALRAIAPDMDRQPLVADLFSVHWLFAGWPPLAQGAPWYYDGLPGIAGASHVMIPDCPAEPVARDRIVTLLGQSDLAFEEVGRTADFALYRIAR